MNVLAVKQGFAMVREHCSSGKGPFYVEFDTYRYHGHSMSDPGTTYRTREEVGGVRTARDPIDYVKKLLTDNNFYTADELKAVEKEIRNEVKEKMCKRQLRDLRHPDPPEIPLTNLFLTVSCLFMFCLFFPMAHTGAGEFGGRQGRQASGRPPADRGGLQHSRPQDRAPDLHPHARLPQQYWRQALSDQAAV